ncbi:MAG: heme o synthase [Leptospiraceae bacterium]|nr:heme o synthase [Leptospiraceae bacterium]
MEIHTAKMSPFRAFLVLAKMRIIFAVILTGFTGMLMVRRDLPRLGEIFDVFLVLLLSGAGSAIVNNLLDTDIDSRMPRTANRDVAIRVLGRRQLWFLSLGIIFISLAYALMFLGLPATLLTLLAIFSYAVWYTLFLKRRSPFGVVLGGLPGALPILIGGYALSNRFAPDIWLLFLWSILWQPAHFWALSLKIREDYADAGIPALPVIYGIEYTKLHLWIYAIPLLPVSMAITIFGGYGWIYSASAIVSGVWYLYVTWVNIKDKKNYGKAFFASLIYMMVLMLAIMADILF